MANRIDWDKARRQRKLHKPDYWEAWTQEWGPLDILPAESDPGLKSPLRNRQQRHSPVGAADIRRMLRTVGYVGSRLNERTTAVLKGEVPYSSVECLYYVHQLVNAGFVPLPINFLDGVATWTFQKTSPSGTVEDQAVMRFGRRE